MNAVVAERIPIVERPRQPGEVIIGTLIDLDAVGTARVDYPGNPARRPLAAEATALLTDQDRGRRVALLFANGNPRRPVIMGLIRDPQEAKSLTRVTSAEPHSTLAVQLDGERLVFSAESEVVLRCGAASITLTRAGKVLIRGVYVSSHASETQRIKGASVQIN
jgi:Domain of unknown function (DUF6484)